MKIELPDCILSYIFSMLSLKDLRKTSTLSKHWRREWELRMDLDFDLQNMSDYSTLQESPKDLPLFQSAQSQFATRLDQFMSNYQGVIIRSIRVNFPLGAQHSDVNDRLITQGIAKGVERIELLFSDEIIRPAIERYNLSFTLFSDTGSLKYLHLQNGLLVTPKEFSGLKNLRTLVLHLVLVEKDLLQSLFSNCIHFVDLTLDDCKTISDLEISSTTLCHLKIVNCVMKINIIASNLSSFNYSCMYDFGVHPISIKAHMLHQLSYSGIKISKLVGFDGLKNLTTIVLDGLRECIQTQVVPHLFQEFLQLEDVTFKNCLITCAMEITSRKLRHLKIINCGRKDFSPCKIVIDACKLTSFEHSGQWTRVFSIKAPRLLKVFWNDSLDSFPRLYRIKNLAIITLPSASEIEKLKKFLSRFQDLRRLEVFIKGPFVAGIIDYFLKLDILKACQHLKKLTLTVSYSTFFSFTMLFFF